MGIDTALYRCRIGCFIQPRKSRLRLQTLTIGLTKISLCIRIVLFYLLCAQCVESNPGPDSHSKTSLGRGACGRGSPAGRGSNRGSNKSKSIAANEPSYTPIGGYRGKHSQSNSNSTHRVQPQAQSPPRTRSTQRQQDLNAWLHDSADLDRPRSRSQSPESLQLGDTHDACIEVNDRYTCTSKADDPDVKHILLEIRGDVKTMNKKFDSLEKSVTSLQKENKALKESNEELTRKVNSLSDTVEQIKFLNSETQKKNEKLEAQSRRDNLKFFGINEGQNETWEQTEDKVRSEISALGIDESKISIERAHRLPGNAKPRPVIVKFSFYKDRESVLKAYRRCRKEGVLTTRIVEDFPERVTRLRTALYPFLRESLGRNKTAFYRFDRLIVDGVSYTYDFDLKQPVQCDK